jgi:formylglycine-generating enzyme required for sulfatase activity
MRVGSTWTYVDGSVLVAVPGGEFIMGRGGSDNPVHTVSLDDFWIYRTKVTNQQYQACVAAGGCSVPDLKDNKG